LRNSDAAFATREMLANELARGRDRLAGKKLVIWEFAARELAFGNWKLLNIRLGTPAQSRFFTPAAGEELQVTGTVEAISPVPRPGSVPYADHITAIHVADMSIAGRAATEPLQAIVYLWSMRGNIWTPGARLRQGDRVTLRLRAWADVSPQLEQINRSEIDDPALQLEEPAWGELVP
jgi:alginate O-acetyltransferase complex protein AlgJ